MNPLVKFLGSGFYTGYFAMSGKKALSATGTFGSLAAYLIYWIPGFENPYIIIPAIIIFTIIGVPISTQFEKAYGKDPKECTIDEVVGMWISLLFLPKTLIISGIAFVLWRFFDIVKLYPANEVEKCHGGIGIMFDDVVSGIHTLIVMQIGLVLFRTYFG